MRNKIIAVYSVFIGISVIVMWSMILLKENQPEGKTELSFHLFSELLLALLCLVSGILLLKTKGIGKSMNILGLGMLIYSVINAAGYYGENNNPQMMAMFIVLFILTSVAILLHFDKKNENKT